MSDETKAPGDDFNARLRKAAAAVSAEAEAPRPPTRESFTESARASAHAALDQWFAEVDRERPDLGMGEIATLRFRGGYGEGYMMLTCRRSIEKEFS